MTVSLRDVAMAVRYGEASFVGESAGYLILGAADRVACHPGLSTLDTVSLTSDGGVETAGFAADRPEAEASLRKLLGQLLELVRSPCPNLQRVVGRQQSIGLAGLISELEAALVPVNRRAARRTLARLARETKKSASRSREFVAVEPVVINEDAPPINEVRLENEKEAALVDECSAGLAQDVAVDVLVHAVSAPSAASAPSAPSAPSAASAPSAVSAASAPSVEVIDEPAHHSSSDDDLFTKRERDFAVQTILPRTRAWSEPVRGAHSAEVDFCEPEHFVDVEFDEAPTQMIAPVAPNEEKVAEGDDEPPHDMVVIREALLFNKGLVERETFASETPRLSEELYLQPAAEIALSSAPSSLDLIVDEPALDLTGPIAAVLPLEPDEEHLAGIVALSRSSQLRRERMFAGSPQPSVLHRLKGAMRESLIPESAPEQRRRPTDIGELLDRMSISAQATDDLYVGLQAMSRVTHSPTPPQVQPDY